MDKMTHDGRIMTSELTSPGYVWYRCDAYGLPDNTMGKIGYHAVYRPLCKPDYIGTEVVTDQMMIDTREHYNICEAEREAESKARFERDLEAIRNPSAPYAIDKHLCPHCGTVCYGDCRS
ncbi:MAG: hypothetical protein WC455_26125 [Dehalococcoidia bacterium]